MESPTQILAPAATEGISVTRACVARPVAGLPPVGRAGSRGATAPRHTTAESRTRVAVRSSRDLGFPFFLSCSTRASSLHVVCAAMLIGGPCRVPRRLPGPRRRRGRGGPAPDAARSECPCLVRVRSALSGRPPPRAPALRGRGVRVSVRVRLAWAPRRATLALVKQVSPAAVRRGSVYDTSGN